MFYGQFNTDAHIAKYFDHVGTCIDVGMAEAIGGNNTYYFEQKGWKCLCIEPNPTYYYMALGIRQHVENVACGDHNEDNAEFTIFTLPNMNQGAISSLKKDDRLVASHRHLINDITTISVNVRTLDTILEKHPWITHIDFISIDTENTELDVLKGFDINRWKPKLIVVENNFDEPFVADYLKNFNYIRSERVGVNDFFIIKS